MLCYFHASARHFITYSPLFLAASRNVSGSLYIPGIVDVLVPVLGGYGLRSVAWRSG